MGFESSGDAGLHDPAQLESEKMDATESAPDERFKGLLAKGGQVADRWDQVAAFGFYTKADLFGLPRDSEFTLATFGEFLDNFGAETNPGWADFNHDFGEACAYYDAAAIVVGGRVLRLVKKQWAGDVRTPTAEDVTHPLTQKLVDGVYWHRFMVTKRGQEILPNVEHVSPAFDAEGKDRQFRDIGYYLFNIAWCSGPFLDGMKPLEMSLFTKRRKFMDETLKRYGVDENADADTLKAAMKKYAEEVDAKEKMAADAKPFEGKETPEEEALEEKEIREHLEGMAASFSIDAKGMPLKVLMSTLRNVAKPAAPVDESAIVARVRAEMKAEADAAAAQKMGAEIAERAVKFGMQFATDAERAEFVAFAAKSPAAAESVIKSLPGAKVMTRFTANGSPKGSAAAPSPVDPSGNPGNVRVMGQSLSAAAKQLLAEGKAKDIATAQVMAIRANPALANE